MRFSNNLVLCLALSSTLLLSPGHAKVAKSAPSHVFFPPPPDDAHLQFRASFSSDQEFSELEGKRNFFRFIVGKDAVMRPIVKPYGIETSPGNIFICDTSMRTICIADLAKKKMRFFTPGGDGALRMPINIAVDSDDTRYIADTVRKQVVIFKGDQYAGAIGTKDEMKPVGVALSKTRIYITDTQNHCVRVYDKADRKQLFTFPKEGEKSGKLFSPTNVAIDPLGNVRVSDTGGFIVHVFDADGKYLSSIGNQGLQPGTFALPKGVEVDRENRTYVVDANTQVIQIFDAQARVLMYFGDPARIGPGATCLPAGIAIDYDNVKYFQSFCAPDFVIEYLVYITNQTGPDKVSVFGFGHKK